MFVGILILGAMLLVSILIITTMDGIHITNQYIERVRGTEPVEMEIVGYTIHNSEIDCTVKHDGESKRIEDDFFCSTDRVGEKVMVQISDSGRVHAYKPQEAGAE